MIMSCCHINSEKSSIDGSVHTAKLYEDVSADESFENEEFWDEVSRLEWDYLDSLHVDKATVNATYNRSTVPSNLHDRFLTDFERDNFHLENVTPNRPCSAFLRTSQFVSAAEVFKPLNGGFTTNHIRCLQRKLESH